MTINLNKQSIPSLLFAILLITSCASKKNVSHLDDLRQNLNTDIIVLSADEMQGREIGTEGERLASEYIQKRFEDIGLEPAGDSHTYFQHFSKKKGGNPHGMDSEGSAGTTVNGRNVVGFIDNKSANTVVIGGHYDHLGYGDEGSLHTGEKAIHNGADDNSSGVAGVLYLAEILKGSAYKANNYLFICFSGEEKGLWGSNYFINNKNNNYNFNYMVNMDMIGRLNGERKLSISGIGTSPAFESIIDNIKQPKFSIKKEYSGLGPSDHASFYNAGIPVLAFFTGQHSDYHKPSDDAHLINYSGTQDILEYIYNTIGKLDKEGKLTFVKTKDETQQRMSFAVTLGVMPDYLYDGVGMKIDGVRDGKPAQNAGLTKGDIVIKMDTIQVTDMQTYMECLSKFKPGQSIKLLYLRNGKEEETTVTF